MAPALPGLADHPAPPPAGSRENSCFELPFRRPHQRHHSLRGFGSGNTLEKAVGKHGYLDGRSGARVPRGGRAHDSAASTIFTSHSL